MLHLLKRGLKRRWKKLLGPRVVAVVSDVEGVLEVAAALPEIGNARPSDGNGVGVRGERGVGVGVREKREGKKLLQT